MSHRKVAGLIDRQTVRSAITARKLKKSAYLECAAIRQQRHPPNRIGPRYIQIANILIEVQHQPVGTRYGVHEAIEAFVRRVAVEAACRIMPPSQSLISEIQIAIAGKDQIIHSLETLEKVPGEVWCNKTALGIKNHDAVLVIGNEDAAVLVDLQAIGLTIILGDEVDTSAVRRNAEDPPIGHVNHVEIADAVERGAFQETVDFFSHLLDSCPDRGLAFDPELVRDAGEDGRPQLLWRGVQHHAACAAARPGMAKPRSSSTLSKPSFSSAVSSTSGGRTYSQSVSPA